MGLILALIKRIGRLVEEEGEAPFPSYDEWTENLKKETIEGNTCYFSALIDEQKNHYVFGLSYNQISNCTWFTECANEYEGMVILDHYKEFYSTLGTVESSCSVREPRGFISL